MVCFMATSSTTYVSKWQNSPTKLVRIPEALASKVLAYARVLDNEGAIEVDQVHEPVLTWGSIPHVHTPINVASVPMRSPFRYPGGKTWMVPYLRGWMSSLAPAPVLFVEPFAGGGICSLTVAFERLAAHVLMGEMDTDVAAVWRAILYGQAEWLANRILNYSLSVGEVRRDLQVNREQQISTRERAFLTILRNRVQRGGIMAPGAGLVKAGENGKGIASRWYPETLARRIREIAAVAARISFVEGDGFALIEQHLVDHDCAFFIDPPYTTAGRRLYVHWQFDHERLFELLARCRGDFLVSYNNAPEIVALAERYGFQTRLVAMKNTHHARMTELLISRELSWLDQYSL